MPHRTPLRGPTLLLAIAMLALPDNWARAAVPSADSIVAGVRVRFLVPKRNPDAATLGYLDNDLITGLDGRPVESIDEIRNLEWLPAAGRKPSLAVVTTSGQTLNRAAPPNWDGLGLREENLLLRRYVSHYAPDHGEAWDKLVLDGLQDFERGRDANSELSLKKALKAGARDAQTSTVLGMLAQHSFGKLRPPRWDESKMFLDGAIDWYERNACPDKITPALARLYLAYCYDQAKDKERALAELEKAYALDKNNSDVVGQLIRAYSDNEKHNERLAVLNDFLQRYPGHDRFWDLKIKTLQQLYRFNDVVAALEERIKQFPDDLTAHQTYLTELERRRDWAGCLKQAGAMISRFGSNLPAAQLLNMKSAYCRYATSAGKEKSAVSYARELAKTRGAAEDFLSLGRIEARLRNWKEAAAAFHEYELKTGRGDAYRINRVRQSIAGDLDVVIGHLSREDLIKYGYKERADNIAKVRKIQRSPYLWLREHSGAIMKTFIWGGAILLLILILVKFLYRPA